MFKMKTEIIASTLYLFLNLLLAYNSFNDDLLVCVMFFVLSIGAVLLIKDFYYYKEEESGTPVSFKY
jgi:hypothetical protein